MANAVEALLTGGTPAPIRLALHVTPAVLPLLLVSSDLADPTKDAPSFLRREEAIDAINTVTDGGEQSLHLLREDKCELALAAAPLVGDRDDCIPVASLGSFEQVGFARVPVASPEEAFALTWIFHRDRANHLTIKNDPRYKQVTSILCDENRAFRLMTGPDAANYCIVGNREWVASMEKQVRDHAEVRSLPESIHRIYSVFLPPIEFSLFARRDKARSFAVRVFVRALLKVLDSPTLTADLFEETRAKRADIYARHSSAEATATSADEAIKAFSEIKDENRLVRSVLWFWQQEVSLAPPEPAPVEVGR